MWESLQIHRLCAFLGSYKELGREELTRCILKISDRYYVMLRDILLMFITGREPRWSELSVEYNGFTKRRVLRVMWGRIFERIRELDVQNSIEAERLFESQFEYADKIYDDRMEQLINRRVCICKVIAYLPIFAVVIFYMICPFVMEGLRLLNTYAEEMQALGTN